MRVSQLLCPSMFALVLVPQLALAGEPEVAVGIDQDPLIYGGTAAKTCGWPTAVYLGFSGWSCSATLVHPEILITAAHCPDSVSGRNATASFGESFGGGARNVTATCYSNPGWTGAVGGQDYGYCKLSSPVTDVPIIPPAFGCEVSAISPGREVVIVGFGQSDNGGSGSKREVTTTLQAIGQQAVIGGGGEDACQGDSGGPVYIKLASEFGGDDTWRAFGITSGGGECGTGGIFSLMHVAIPWIETHSGVDITPCHDSEGNWDPSPSCGAIPLDPANTNGASWSNGCSGGPTSGFSALCGDAFGSGDDPDAPSVAITNPTSGTTVELPPGESTVEVTIDVQADDGDGFGVADVKLLVNGQEFAGNTDSSAPYSWNMVFPAGGFVIEAVASDWVGNQSAPDAIAIGVGQAAPDLPDDGGDEGSATDDGGSGEDEGPAEGGGGSGETGSEPGVDSNTSSCMATDSPSRSSLLGLLALLGLAGVRRRRHA